VEGVWPSFRNVCLVSANLVLAKLTELGQNNEASFWTMRRIRLSIASKAFGSFVSHVPLRLSLRPYDVNRIIV
jgi:hypothetical protein